MENRSLVTDLLKRVESMVDPNATSEQQLLQMQAQLNALTELPKVINQKLESVNRQISQISMKQSTKKEIYQQQYVEIKKHNEEQRQLNRSVNPNHSVEITELPDEEVPKGAIQIQVTKPSLTIDELAAFKNDEFKKLLENKAGRGKDTSIKSQIQTTHDQKTAQRAKITPAFGLGNQERPLYLPGGRRWRMSEYDEDQISETLTAQAEVIKGNAIGVNFKKFEKPPVGLDHLKNSEVYKAVHNQVEAPALKKVQFIKPIVGASEVTQGVQLMSAS